jgi:putative acetyltransferase
MAVEPPSESAVRPMTSGDLPALLDLWVESWQAAYPAIDFGARRDWAEARFAELQRNGARIFVAEAQGRLAGAVSVEPATGYIDQIVVATQSQRRGIASRLIEAARGASSGVLELHVNQDNAPAVAFYRREGFAVAGHDANPRSGAPTFRMIWRAGI